MRKNTIVPMSAYATSAPPGPAVATVLPDATKSPVPMEPPIAIMFRCRALSDRLSAGGVTSGDPASVSSTL
jgi:hypothetical protein